MSRAAALRAAGAARAAARGAGVAAGDIRRTRPFRSRLAGKPVPAFALAAGVAGQAGLSSADLATGRRGWSISSPAGACRASPKRRCCGELKRRGVAIDGIAVRDRPEDLAAFLAAQRRSVSSGSAPTAQSRVQIALGSSGVPESFIVDGRGIIRYQHIGPIEAAATCPTILAQAGEGANEAVAAPASRCWSPRSPLLADSDLPPAYWANRQLPDPRQEAKAAGADGGAALPGLPGPVDRRSATPSWPATCATWFAGGSPRARSPTAIRAWLIERYGNWISYARRSSRRPGRCGWRRLRCLLAGALLVRRRIGAEARLMGWLDPRCC